MPSATTSVAPGLTADAVFARGKRHTVECKLDAVVELHPEQVDGFRQMRIGDLNEFEIAVVDARNHRLLIGRRRIRVVVHFAENNAATGRCRNI